MDHKRSRFAVASPLHSTASSDISLTRLHVILHIFISKIVVLADVNDLIAVELGRLAEELERNVERLRELRLEGGRSVARGLQEKEAQAAILALQ